MSVTPSSPHPLNSRFSQSARRALSQARLWAEDCQHAEVDTDHLLVGILRATSSLGCRVLVDLGADEDRAAQEVRALHTLADGSVRMPDLTGALIRSLVLAEDESAWFGHYYVGTEHLLLALARSREGGAPEVMRALAISPDQIRRRVRLLLNEGVTELSIEAAKRVARLSELSRRVLNAAQQLASQAEGHSAGLPHLLVVLARERRSMSSRWLCDAGLNLAALEAAVSRMLPEEALVQAALLEDVIDSAVNHADGLGMHYTGTDHMLLALALHGHGAPLLRAYGVDPVALAETLRRALTRQAANGGSL